MLALDTAVSELYARAPRLAGESVSFAHACGRVSAKPLFAPFDWPMQACSSMDGYAFSHADALEATILPVSHTIYAGERAASLAPGACARVLTGSLLPPGADTVVMQEQVERLDDSIRFIHPVPAKGAYVRHQASVYARGDELMAVGQWLGPQQIALVASTGCASVSVTKKPRVALLSTGDELVQVDGRVTGLAVDAKAGKEVRPLEAWECVDSNQPQVAALLQGLGCEVSHQAFLPDSLERLEEGMANLATECDLLVTCGGASVGDRDFLNQAVSNLGVVHSWKIAMRPGKPFLFGSINRAGGVTPVLCLPGNPLSAFITSLLLVRPFVGGMLGLSFAQITPTPFSLVCDFSFSGDSKRVMLLQVRQDGEQLHLAGVQLSDQLVAAARADGVAMLQPGQNVARGERLPYLPYSSLLGWR